MKKLGLLVLITAFVFIGSVVEVYADATLTDGANVGSGTITIVAGTFARQSAALTFKTSQNVYVFFDVSPSDENYTASAAHTNGDKAYGMDSTGGGVWYKARAATGTAPTTSDMGSPGAVDTGAATWTNWSTM